MKKIIILSFLLCAYNFNAQNWSLTGNANTNASNFIGTTDAKDLVLKANNLERMSISTTGTRIGMDSPTNDALFVYNNTENVSAGIDLLFLRYGKYQPNNPNVLTVSGMTTPTKYEAFFNLRANGKLGLGTYNFQSCADCKDYRLFVKDGIKTEKVKVEIAAENGWADYVFADDYQLQDLNNLEKFIKKNKHLPEVPTTDEAIKTGIELKAMNILLLKKVEELTLYLIQQNKRIEILENNSKK